MYVEKTCLEGLGNFRPGAVSLSEQSTSGRVLCLTRHGSGKAAPDRREGPRDGQRDAAGCGSDPWIEIQGFSHEWWGMRNHGRTISFV